MIDRATNLSLELGQQIPEKAKQRDSICALERDNQTADGAVNLTPQAVLVQDYSHGVEPCVEQHIQGKGL